MTTAHNEHTGASLTTAGKGSLEKYAQGWDRLFGAKKVASDLAAVRAILKNKPEPKCKACNGTRCDYRRSAFGDPPEHCEECWEDGGEDAPMAVAAFDGGVQVPVTISTEGGKLSFEFPTTVMALDFHDSVAVKRDIFDDMLEDMQEQEAAQQAREDAWRDAVMRNPSSVSPSEPS
jgi:hypothetical protein